MDDHSLPLSNAWKALEQMYDTLSAADKTALTADIGSGQGKVFDDAMERYDFLVGKYELKGFIVGRTPEKALYVNNGISEMGKQSAAPAVIAAIAAVLTCGAGAIIFLLRKKRKQN